MSDLHVGVNRGIALSSDWSAGPSGQYIAYFTIPSFSCSHRNQDQITDFGNQTSMVINMKQRHRVIDLRDCYVVPQTQAAVNHHEEVLDRFMDMNAYFSKTTGGVYHKFRIRGTLYDYLRVNIRRYDFSDDVTDGFKYTISMRRGMHT